MRVREKKTERPRVLFLNSCVSGGGPGHSLTTYLKYAHGDVDAQIAMPGPGVLGGQLRRYAELHYVPEFLERPLRPPYRWVETMRGLPWVGGFVALLVAAAKLTRLAASLAPDVIYCNHMLAKPLGAYVGWRLGIPVIFHGRNIHSGRWIERPFYQFLARRDATRLIVCNSKATAEPYSSVCPAKVHVVPNFVDLRHFSRARVRPRLRAELGLADDVPVLGYVGRLTHWKGVGVAIRAFKELRARGSNAVLVVIGDNDGGLSQDLFASQVRLTEELGVAEYVKFIGFRADVRPYMADLDLLLLPSLRPEPFGRVLIEALALEIPAVIAAHGGATEIVRDGVEGLWARPNDSLDFAAKAGRLLADPALRRRFGEAGRARVEDKFDGVRQSTELTRLILQTLRPQPQLGCIDAQPAR